MCRNVGIHRGENAKYLTLFCESVGIDFILVAQSKPDYKPLMELLAAANEVADNISFRYQDVRLCPTQVIWDIVVSDVVTPQGMLQEGIFEKLAHLRLLFVCLFVCLLLLLLLLLLYLLQVHST